MNRMKKYSLLFLLLIFYPAYLCAQQQEEIIREDRIENDTVVWKSSKGSSLIWVSVKGDEAPNNRCRQKIPKGMTVEAYEGKVHYFMEHYIQCKVDSLNDVFLSCFAKETLEQVLQSDLDRPLILFFTIKENGEIHSVSIAIRKALSSVLNSAEYYKIQNLLKCNVTFIAPTSVGLVGCIRFTIPIKKTQIQARLLRLKDANYV